MEDIKYRAIKYIRLSNSDEKIGESDSITNQRRLIDDFLKRHPEIEVVGEKIDDGYSGILFDRPGFQEMMDEIKNSRANCCVTKDLSRFGREFVETGRHLREILPKLGARFIAINDNIDTLYDKAYDLDISMRTIVNDSYCRDISKKTRSALDAKRESGEYVGAFTAYGYRKSESNHNLLVVDEDAATIVKEIFSMKIDGFSTSRIAEILNDRGVPSPINHKKDNGLPYSKSNFGATNESKWSVPTITRILKNETYTGTLIQGRTGTPNYKLRYIVKKPIEEWKRVENTHEPIITKYDFELTKRILQLDTRTPKNEDRVNVFSGLLICGTCGAQMSKRNVLYKDARYPYFCCPTSKKRGCKQPVMIREERLCQVVLSTLKAHLKNMTVLDDIMRLTDADKAARQLADNNSKQIAENKRRIHELSEVKATLFENMRKEIITKNEYVSFKKQFESEIYYLMSKNEDLKVKTEEALSCCSERLALKENFEQLLEITELNRKIVVYLINFIKVVNKEHIVIAFNYQNEFNAVLQEASHGS